MTIPELSKKKKEGKKITMVTAYDYPFARIVDESGVDIILIGDSLGMVVRGEPNTLNVTMDEMLYHTRMVARGTQKALVIGDMPFLSFQISVAEAVRNAGRFLQAGAEAIKIEGGIHVTDRIKAIYRVDIPVMGHIGLTPQSIHRMGGYRVQGREEQRAENIISEAKAVEDAGAFGVVLEGVPLTLAKKITKSLSIPTIGIGAGAYCDGQVLVLYDILGITKDRQPTFVKNYADIKGQALDAIRRFKEEVEMGKFPSEEESYR